MPCTSRAAGISRNAFRLIATLGLFALLAPASGAHAQMCGGMEDEDGGMACVDPDDAGQPPLDDGDDAGVIPMAGSGGHAGSAGAGAGGMSGAAGGGMDGGVRGDGAACSCDAVIDDEKQGRIHVCTEGNSRAACSDFSCTRGRIMRLDACEHANVRLCCVMDSRDLVSVLYDDCTHANCEAGFTQQCGDFGGTLHRGDCDAFVSGGGDDHDGGGGGCAIASERGPDMLAGLALGALGLLLARRRRRFS